MTIPLYPSTYQYISISFALPIHLIHLRIYHPPSNFQSISITPSPFQSSTMHLHQYLSISIHCSPSQPIKIHHPANYIPPSIPVPQSRSIHSSLFLNLSISCNQSIHINQFITLFLYIQSLSSPSAHSLSLHLFLHHIISPPPNISQ